MWPLLRLLRLFGGSPLKVNNQGLVQPIQTWKYLTPYIFTVITTAIFVGLQANTEFEVDFLTEIATTWTDKLALVLSALSLHVLVPFLIIAQFSVRSKLADLLNNLPSNQLKITRKGLFYIIIFSSFMLVQSFGLPLVLYFNWNSIMDKMGMFLVVVIGTILDQCIVLCPIISFLLIFGHVCDKLQVWIKAVTSHIHQTPMVIFQYIFIDSSF